MHQHQHSPPDTSSTWAAPGYNGNGPRHSVPPGHAIPGQSRGLLRRRARPDPGHLHTLLHILTGRAGDVGRHAHPCSQTARPSSPAQIQIQPPPPPPPASQNHLNGPCGFFGAHPHHCSCPCDCDCDCDVRADPVSASSRHTLLYRLASPRPRGPPDAMYPGPDRSAQSESPLTSAPPSAASDAAYGFADPGPGPMQGPPPDPSQTLVGLGEGAQAGTPAYVWPEQPARETIVLPLFPLPFDEVERRCRKIFGSVIGGA